jgi:Zn-dependent peptidase ImmA (M78 family)
MRGVAGTVREAEYDAARLLKSWWWETPDQDEPLPVNPLSLARGLGITVIRASLPPDESGKIVIPPGGDVTISLNKWDGQNRQRFTCAHEIAHYLRREQQGRIGQTFVDYRDTLAGMGRDPVEIYANQFAAALLMPAHLVQQGYMRDKLGLEDLADRFYTSSLAMRLRLRNLNLA